jgi:hypothetical protein
VIALREQGRPEPRELRACALAALAEAGVIYLPIHLVLTQTRRVSFSILVWAVPFVAAYVAGAALACWYRSSRSLATSAGIAALGVGVAVGHGDLNTSVFALVLALLVAFRIVTLGLRDWRTPLHAEIGWFAVALGFETIIGSGPDPEWRPLLVVVVPVFFVAALASRASTVWTSGGAHDLDEHVRASWIRRAGTATVALVCAMAGAFVLSVRGGLFDRIGSALTPVAGAVAMIIGYILGELARPFFWLVDRLGIDPSALRNLLARLRNGGLGKRLREDAARPDAALWQRALGLLVFLAIAYAIYRIIRRARPMLSFDERPTPGVVASAASMPDEPVTTNTGWFRRELPADVVRRWYAETLLALERRRVSKEPALTPAEFTAVVGAAYPSCGDAFRSLTRAYEDVRYGNLRLGDDAVRDLGRQAKRVIEVVRREEPLRDLAVER